MDGPVCSTCMMVIDANGCGCPRKATPLKYRRRPVIVEPPKKRKGHSHLTPDNYEWQLTVDAAKARAYADRNRAAYEPVEPVQGDGE